MMKSVENLIVCVCLVIEVPVDVWIRSKFKLKIDRVKMPWQEYGVVAHYRPLF